MDIMMKKVYLIIAITSVYAGCGLAEKRNASPQAASLPISSFANSLEPGQRILEEPGWMNWCMAPIYDDQMQLHLCYCRWPKKGSWLKHAQIVHTTASNPGRLRHPSSCF